MTITHDTTIDAILEDLPAAQEVFVQHFGAGVTAPGNMWTAEPLARACRIRGVDVQRLLEHLRHLPRS